jgi:hypothetical protein
MKIADYIAANANANGFRAEYLGGNNWRLWDTASDMPRVEFWADTPRGLYRMFRAALRQLATHTL